MSDLDYLVRSRGYMRSSITKFCDKISRGLEGVQKCELTTCISKLNQMTSDIRDLDSKINPMKFATSDEGFVQEMDVCNNYYDKLLASLATVKMALETCDVSNSVNSDVPQSGTGQSLLNKLKLPQVPLPTYCNAKDETLAHFFTQFENVINKYNLGNYEKYMLLKGQVSGEPLTLINSLGAAEQSYGNAKALLQQAFASDVGQKFDAIKRLTLLDLNSGGNPYEYISELRVVTELFRTLDIGVDTVQQYFAWKGMTNEMQGHLMSICNNNKPSLGEIMNNFFKAVDRNKETNMANVSTTRHKKDKIPSSKTFASNAVNVRTVNSDSSRLPFCSLCSVKGSSKVTSHSTRTCPEYDTVDAKLKRLQQISGCTRCGLSNHPSVKCTFKFRRNCFECDGDHMTYLCKNSNKTKPEISSKPDKNKTGTKNKSGRNRRGHIWGCLDGNFLSGWNW